MIITPDGQQIQRIRRRRRKDVEAIQEANTLPQPSSPVADEEVSTFLQLEEEAKRFSAPGRECPVPKPTGFIGDLLGFSNPTTTQTGPGEGQQADVGR